jgi:hypothetical protein
MEIKNAILPKEKNPSGRAPKYSVEYYMMMAKQVVDDGLTYRDAAKIYGCSHGTVNHWLKLYKNGVLPNKSFRAATFKSNLLTAILNLTEWPI